jgi:hypothetical protein
METKYTIKDLGCFIDGAVPRTQVERILVLADMIAAKDPSLLHKLGIPGEYFLLKMEQEELDDIDRDLIDALPEVTMSGLVWFQEAGDLILMAESESNS